MLIFLLWMGALPLWGIPTATSFLSFLSDTLPTTHRTDTATVSSGPFSCTAIMDGSEDGLHTLFAWQADDCGGLEQDISLESWIETDQAWTELPGINHERSLFLDIPLGLHRFVLLTSDACGQTATDTLYFQIADQIAPQISCRNNLTLNLEEGGTVSLRAADFTASSEDNCGEISLRIRRAVANSCVSDLLALGYDSNNDGILTEADGFTTIDGVLYTPWAETIPFFCCDAGFSQVVGVQAVDQAGNVSICSQTVRIEDRQEPACRAPLGVRLGCNDARLRDLKQLGMASPWQNDCGTITIEELPVAEDLDDCGAGTLTRSFQAVKNAGTAQEERSEVCTQTVQIVKDHHYSICFPADTTVGCLETDALAGVNLVSGGCELFAVTQNDERFFPGDAGEGCYQVRRTFQIINWCEYTGAGAPVVVGRDWDGWNGTNPEEPTGNGKAGDRPICVTVTRFFNDVFPDTVWYDSDTDPHNDQPEFSSFSAQDGYYWRVISGNANPASSFYYAGNGTSWGNNPQDSTTEADGYGSNGFWQYTQVVTVEDRTAPTLLQGSPQDTFLAVSGSDCSAEASFLFELNDDCLLSWNDYTFSVSLDLDSDGNEDESPYLDLALFPEILITGRYPLGTHQLVITATDLCGNETVLNHSFAVVDRRAPRPVCINGLTVELEPAPPGDSIGVAGVPIFVENFIASSTFDCSGDVQYSINLIDEEFNPEQDGLVLTCADLGTVVVEIYAWDNAGNRESCETYVLVQDRQEPVCNADNLGHVSGLVTTPELAPLPGASVRLAGPFERTQFTDDTGEYSFANLQKDYTYQVTPVYNQDHVNGVSTYDIYLIQQHILGVEPFTSPYQFIAADANRSGTVSVSDMVQIRKLVLSVDVTLADNTSWRFVDSRHSFDQPQNALIDGFPERVIVRSLPADSLIFDFTAVKIGDVSGNALTDIADVRSFYAEGPLGLLVDDMALQPGVLYPVPVRISAVEKLQSLQFALAVNPELARLRKVQGELLTENQMAVFAEAQTITTSWVAPPGKNALPDTSLLTLMLEVDRPVYISDILSLSPRYTGEEAIVNGEMYIPELQFKDNAAMQELMQAAIYPNPVRSGQDVVLTFTLQTSSQVDVQIIDGRGRTLTQKQVFLPQGRHAWSLRQEDFAGAGWYALRLTTAEHAVTLPLIMAK